MKEGKYNILWIDDEHDGMSGFKGDAKYNNILLHPFKSYNGGIKELQNRFSFYDGILFDAKFLENEDDEIGSEDTDYIHRAKEELLQLPKKFELFVLTGQAEAYDDDTFNKAFKNVYSKGKDSDIEQLFIDLKTAASKQIETQIRHEHLALFSALESYDDEHKKTMLELLKAIKSGDQDVQDHLYFTPIRMILEKMFRKANEIGLLHDDCVTVKGSQVNLTESSNFLAGRDTKFLKVRCKKTHFPKLITDSVKNILFITGAASHTSNVNGAENIDIQAYREAINTPYLLFHLLFMLSDVLIWFNKYAKENPDSGENKLHWEDLEFDSNNNKWEHGKLTKISDGWGTVIIFGSGERVSVHRDVVRRKNLQEGEDVRVTIKRKTVAHNIEIT